MPLTARDWNVIVLGYWNRGILTPAGVATRLFNLPGDAVFSVQLPVDAIGPYRVVHENVAVMVTGTQLAVEPTTCDFQRLERAMAIAAAAMTGLPETPVTAAGYNVRYEGSSEDEHLACLATAVGHEIDGRLARFERTVGSRGLVRVVDWKNGRIQFTITKDEPDTFKISINFERTGCQGDLVAWLSMPIGDIEEAVRFLLVDLLGVPVGGMP